MRSARGPSPNTKASAQLRRELPRERLIQLCLFEHQDCQLDQESDPSNRVQGIDGAYGRCIDTLRQPLWMEWPQLIVGGAVATSLLLLDLTMLFLYGSTVTREPLS
jgi:hypothetical protein